VIRNQPPLEKVLGRMRSTDQKGGTIIFQRVTDFAEHERRIGDPDGYRPAFCPRCFRGKLHVHDYRGRVLRAEPGKRKISTVRFECVSCEAIWHILPMFLARHLQRTWRVVERVLMPDAQAPSPGEETNRWPKVPPRTVRRWRQRWLRPAHALVQALTTSGPLWAALAIRRPVGATCASLTSEFAAGYVGEPLAGLAALIYRLQPNFRLL
jgi:hypothetical protein